MPGQSRNFLRDRKLVSESCCLPIDIMGRRFVIGKDVPVVVDASGGFVHPVRVGARAVRGGRRRGRGGGRGELFG